MRRVVPGVAALVTVREVGLVEGAVGVPAYRQVAEELRRQIAAGELAVGSAIPSTARITALYGVSSTVARAAVAELRAEGLVVGAPGKGVFVRATPSVAAERALSVEELGRRLAELQGEVDALRAEVRELRRRVDAAEG